MYKKHIIKAIDFIEDNLKSDISIDHCAAAAGYSKYHFIRIFNYATGINVGDYIRKRRLAEIIKQIDENTPFTDFLFEYGFNSKENFTRAFLTEHHILPTEYKNAFNSLKLYNKLTFDDLNIEIIPQIKEMDEFIVVAYKSDEEYIPKFWNKYNSRKWSQVLTKGEIRADYGISCWNNALQKVEYFIGVHKNDAKGDLTNTCEVLIKSGLYAVFDTPVATPHDFINQIHRTWKYIYSIWLPQSDYICTGGLSYETYVEQSRLYSEKIYIPIKKKEN